MSNLRRGMISAHGPGWAVLGDHGDIKYGRWASEEEATRYGLLGVYLLSGHEVVEVET